MTTKRFLMLMLILFSSPLVARSEPGKITKEALTSGEKKRSYYLYVPKKVAESKTPAPLVVTLHGTGRNGRILVEHWQELADKEGIIIAGPDSMSADSMTSDTWMVPRDGPEFLRDVVESVKSKYAVNARQVYLFGHSAGGGFAIYMAVMESEYFAAAFIHAGAVPEGGRHVFSVAARKTPIALVVGTEDPFFPVALVRSTRDALKANGFDVPLTEINGHNHNYYARSKEINKLAWEFLKGKELKDEPKFTEYRYK